MISGFTKKFLLLCSPPWDLILTLQGITDFSSIATFLTKCIQNEYSTYQHHFMLRDISIDANTSNYI